MGPSTTQICGITISERSIICAGGIIPMDIPPNKIFACKPAKILRKKDKE